MSLPKHTNPTRPRTTKVSSSGKDKFDVWARAPYNFVPLPEKVICSAPAPLDKFEGNTGYIKCDLTTLSPLYIRNLMRSLDFSVSNSTAFYELVDHETKLRQTQFFHIADDHASIPGSSIRGMLRSLIEIITYAKVQPVSNEPIVYRAVADGMRTALGIHYKEQLDKTRIHAGYITQCDSEWRVRPAKLIEGCAYGVLQVPEDPKPKGETLEQLKNRLSDSKWADCKNAYLINAEIGSNNDNVCSFYKLTKGNQYVLVITDKTPGLRPPKNHPEDGTKKNQYIFGLPNDSLSADNLVKISHDMARVYQEQLSEEQKKLLGDEGVLRENQPVFYLVDEKGELIFFGHARYFRLPYISSANNLVPDELKDESIIDMAEAMFGFVSAQKTSENNLPALAGRIFVEDASCEKDLNEILLSDEENQNKQFDWFTPKILSSPKPTTFQHYLVQDFNRKHDPDCKENLAHYDTPSSAQTVIRGNKLYWHKSDPLSASSWQFENGPSTKPEIFEDKLDQTKTQLTGIQPVKAGVEFNFTIRFENLRDEELGALLWVLSLPKGHAHKLGMGKPLGLGSVKIAISKIALSNRKNRYSDLFSQDNWSKAEEETSAQRFIDKFETHVVNKIVDAKIDFQLLPRIQSLLRLLEYPGPDTSWTRYMEIERTKEYDGQKLNEYSDRPVLPDPFHISLEDCVGHRTEGDCANLPMNETFESSETNINPLNAVTVTQKSHLSSTENTILLDTAQRFAKTEHVSDAAEMELKILGKSGNRKWFRCSLPKNNDIYALIDVNEPKMKDKQTNDLITAKPTKGNKKQDAVWLYTTR